MSFILDAIKKSESERQRKAQPEVYSLQDGVVRESSAVSRSRQWLLLIAATVILLVIFWWLGPKIAQQFGLPLQVNTQQSGANENVGPKGAELVERKVERGEGPQQPASNIHSLKEAGAASGTDSTELPPRHLIKELWEMPADYQSTVPAMEFSFHVFSQDPERRTIIINGRRLREGQMVASQLQLRVITSTGVIFFFKDRYFHVDVVEKW